MSDHLEWDLLNELADGTRRADDDAVRREHLRSCAECRQRLDALAALVREAGAAPREVAPPLDAWATIRARVEERKVVPLGGAGAQGRRSSPRWMAAAAALVLVVGSSAVTAWLLRGVSPADGGRGVQDTAMVTQGIPAALAERERPYLVSVAALTKALDVARTKLSPSTIAIVERNLAIINAAITESREALLRDPGNRVLLEVLTGTYEQKLDLLRRAAQLTAS